MSKLAFLGAGRMAGAIVDGLLASGHHRPADFACLGGAGGTARKLAERTGIQLAADLRELVTGADVLVLACKPQQLATLDAALAELTRGCLVVSVLAGKRLKRLAAVFPHARNLVRTMPNTPGQIGAGITGWCSLTPLSESDAARVAALLGALGKSVSVPEEQIDALTAVSGSGPAYVFEFAAALRDAGVAAGLSPADSRALAIETLLGASKLLAASPAEPEDLRNQVTSPNGTTFAGLRVLEGANFRELIRNTVAAAKKRSEELSQDA
ncbi:pyrroline-5-carboxylate reductase [Nibricoccus sp. IMCC34717]|uniref:pyrroline-5-carboxylate reductase n=1 Tax=Nibricoccus sp. IMCC34717 TaxID=3034021 RepID=UPI00384A9A58